MAADDEVIKAARAVEVAAASLRTAEAACDAANQQLHRWLEATKAARERLRAAQKALMDLCGGATNGG